MLVSWSVYGSFEPRDLDVHGDQKNHFLRPKEHEVRRRDLLIRKGFRPITFEEFLLMNSVARWVWIMCGYTIFSSEVW